ncbi:hypothetical protein PpBr36_04913 [Pyricularia pennisetigena]|uniref:hypothetical protein n=1 Tax=Pyricularia pennisetigena TaxID=1578925 RepID=UPI0011531D9F|nr:hypothetical protein PpBr36_04913 [Pyricularia pennisetigena]TLS26367.1 hypothetical protein PpBr36_04913 [Pyricularia pennisetigena]
MAPSTIFSLALAVAGVLATPQPARLDYRTINPAEPAVFGMYSKGAEGNGSSIPAHVDSPHFRIYLGSSTTEAQATKALKPLEAAYDCFVGKLGFVSSGLHQYGTPEKGPYYKTEIYMVDTLTNGPEFDGYTQYDTTTGRAWVKIKNGYLERPYLSVHEYGHVLHWHQGLRNAWARIPNCQPWNEALANWVADVYLTSGDDVCGPSRTKFDAPGGDSVYETYKVVGESYLSIVDATSRTKGNPYQAWPFFQYLFRNPDNFEGLGQDVVPAMLRATPDVGTDETPLHVLQRVMGESRKVQEVVAKYWARMANGDIGHESIQKSTLDNKQFMHMYNFPNPPQDGAYRVSPDRAPQYMGATMGKLVMAEGVRRADVNVTAVNATMAFTAMFAVRDSATSKVRYQTLEGGSGSVDLAATEDATLVVVNTPATLLKYNAGILNMTEAARKLDFSVSMTGATFAKF